MVAKIIRIITVSLGLFTPMLNLPNWVCVGLALTLSWMIILFFFQTWTNLKLKKVCEPRRRYPAVINGSPDLPLIEFKEVMVW